MLNAHYPAIGVGLVLLLLSMPAELFPAFVWMYVVDGLIYHTGKAPIPQLEWVFTFNGTFVSWQAKLASALSFLTVVYVFGETMETLSSNVMQRVAEKFIVSLRQNVYRKLQGQSLTYLQQQRTGDLMSRAIGDVDEVRSFIVGGIDVIVGEGLMWIITVVTVMLLDWKVASSSLLPLMAVYLMLRVFNQRVAPIYKAARDSAGRVSSRLQENLAGVVVIKIFGREKDEAARFSQATGQYYNDQLKAINARSLYFPVARAVGFLSNVLMIGVGGYSILSGGSFTVGKLVAFRGYWWRLFGPVQTLARVNDMVQRARAACVRIFELLDSPEDLTDAAGALAVATVRGEMALDRVTFAYQNNEPVLHDVSIHIAAGKTVALCGPSGSGKSTVLNLLLRFYDPAAGVVLLDGHDLKSVRRDSFRKQMALVQQETFLFNESIADNIRYGQTAATMKQVEQAARTASAHEFIERLPGGYETKVGERGVRLSGGQKQRLSIARAFLADPKILLLDEPTSSVEPDSEAAIIDALGRLMNGRTTVLTSHRPSLIARADVVYVIEAGRVLDSGPPAEVRQRNRWLDRFLRSGDELALV